MAHKSIVDRVLMLAAAICAAALAWQLTVLLTSKRNPTTPRLAAVATAPVLAGVPAATALDAAPSTPVRIVYPGADTAVKTSVKATDALAPAAPPPLPESASTAPAASLESKSSPAETPQAAVAPVGAAAASTDQSEFDQAGQTTSTVSPTQVATAEASTTASGSAAATPEGAVDLNHASVEALNHLRGAGRIGLAIVSHRPYRSVEDLVKKRVLRRNVFEQIRQQVVTQ